MLSPLEDIIPLDGTSPSIRGFIPIRGQAPLSLVQATKMGQVPLWYVLNQQRQNNL
ncbi:MAG: hypothetical protein WBM86_09700 [Waterburya sp.]